MVFQKTLETGRDKQNDKHRGFFFCYSLILLFIYDLELE